MGPPDGIRPSCRSVDRAGSSLVCRAGMSRLTYGYAGDVIQYATAICIEGPPTLGAGFTGTVQSGSVQQPLSSSRCDVAQCPFYPAGEINIHGWPREPARTEIRPTTAPRNSNHDLDLIRAEQGRLPGESIKAARSTLRGRQHRRVCTVSLCVTARSHRLCRCTRPLRSPAGPREEPSWDQDVYYESSEPDRSQESPKERTRRRS
jgi:hypothetical protein